MFSNNELIEHGPYNELVRSLFENPLHAKDIPEKLGKPYKVVTQESKNGPKIVLTAVIKEENILALRFRVFGCPFLIAAAEFCCNQCEGKHNKEVENIDIFYVAPGDLAQSMGLPGGAGTPEVNKVVDGALRKIGTAGRTPGTLAGHQSVPHYIDLGTRFFSFSWLPWLSDGAEKMRAAIDAAS